jgi:hypothetical protein
MLSNPVLENFEGDGLSKSDYKEIQAYRKLSNAG